MNLDKLLYRCPVALKGNSALTVRSLVTLLASIEQTNNTTPRQNRHHYAGESSGVNQVQVPDHGNKLHSVKVTIFGVPIDV